MWKYLDKTLAYYSTNLEPYRKYKNVIMFDLDFTLVKPLDRRTYPKDVDDWRWMFGDKETLGKLDKLIVEGYLLVIISNQSKSNKTRFILDRISLIVDETNLPFEVYVATDYDKYRKPNTEIFEKYVWEKLDPNFDNLIYVGDAAGRENDFSDSDRKFAYNIHLFLKHIKNPGDIKFYTPEEFFQNSKETKEWRGFNPSEFIKEQKLKAKDKSWKEELDQILSENQQKVLILIGPPASGKSTLAKKIQEKDPKIVHISRDLYSTKIKTTKAFREALQTGESIVLDNTNPSKQVREEYIQEALETNPKIKIYLIHMNNFDDLEKNKGLYEHLNIYRERLGTKNRVPEIAYKIFYKNYEEPDESKVEQILQIPFSPKFKNKNQVLRFIQKS